MTSVAPSIPLRWCGVAVACYLSITLLCQWRIESSRGRTIPFLMHRYRGNNDYHHNNHGIDNRSGSGSSSASGSRSFLRRAAASRIEQVSIDASNHRTTGKYALASSPSSPAAAAATATTTTAAATPQQFRQELLQNFTKDHPHRDIQRIKAVLQQQRQLLPSPPSPFLSFSSDYSISSAKNAVRDATTHATTFTNSTASQQGETWWYDIKHCPLHPPPNYPYEWNALQVLEHWNIDDTTIPTDYIHQGLCILDWTTDQEKIRIYRQAEVPFVMVNHPVVLQTAERWSTAGYLEQLLGKEKQRNEHSQTNHFMFWRPVPSPRYNPFQRGKGTEISPTEWHPPTDTVELSYLDWLRHAERIQRIAPTEKADRYYFRLNGVRDTTNAYLYDELPFFNSPPDGAPTVFLVEPDHQRGINCRFGMRGIFAEAHFDTTRNWITVLRGQRRYLLANYTQCAHFQLYPPNHPSGRHSRIDWSRPREHLQQDSTLAGFTQATMNEVVLQAGDALYLPTSWIHAIVSLNINYQCNARSGTTQESWDVLQECGFGNIHA